MYDLERLEIIISDIEMYFSKLDLFEIKSIDDLDDLKFYASSMVAFSLLNKSIDLAEEIVRQKDLGTPMQYSDLFDILLQTKIISKEICESMKDLIRLRNQFSHRYGNIKN